MKSNCLPCLPPEIHTRILDFLPPHDAWSLRRVCHNWRDYIELVLARKYWLPRLEITFDPRRRHFMDASNPLDYKDMHKATMSRRFTFSGLHSEDGSVAYFSDPSCPEPLYAVARFICEDVQPFIWLNEIVNDVRVPSLRFHWDTMMLSVNWKAVLAALLNEEAEVERRQAEQRAQYNKSLEALWDTASRGYIGQETLFTAVLNRSEGVRISAYESTRMDRLGTYEARGDMKLKFCRQIARWRAGLVQADDE